MTSILFLTERIYRNQFKCSYLRNKALFLHFFAPFLKSISNYERFEKKDDRHRLCIFDFTESERHG